MRYHEIKVYSVIHQSYDLASKYFENFWQLLLKVNLIKLDHLLSILNQINNNIQCTIEKSQLRLTFLDIMI